jgi:hypothetical protein
MNQRRVFTAALSAAIVAILMVFATTASASSFTSKGSVYEGEIKASGNGKFEGTECSAATIVGQAESAVGYVNVKLSQMSFAKCPEGMTVTSSSPAALRIAPSFPTVSAIQIETTITITNHLTGRICTYRPAGVTSRFYPSSATKSTAGIEILQLLKLVEGNGFCAEEMNWSGIYTVTTPDELNIH